MSSRYKGNFVMGSEESRVKFSFQEKCIAIATQLES